MKHLLIILLLLVVAGCRPERTETPLIITLTDGSEERINAWTYRTPDGGGLFTNGSGRKLVVYSKRGKEIKTFAAGSWASIEWASYRKVRKLELRLDELQEKVRRKEAK